MCNDYEYNCSCFMNVTEQLYCNMVASRSASDVHFSLRKQITEQVFQVKKLVGLPSQLKLLALALNCWLG